MAIPSWFGQSAGSRKVNFVGESDSLQALALAFMIIQDVSI